MLPEVAPALLPGADEVGVGRVLVHSVDIQEQESSAIPATEGVVFKAIHSVFFIRDSLKMSLECLLNFSRICLVLSLKVSLSKTK